MLCFLLFLTRWASLEQILMNHTEKELKENRDRLAIALKASNCGIWDWDLQTDEFFFDDTFFQIAGYETK